MLKLILIFLGVATLASPSRALETLIRDDEDFENSTNLLANEELQNETDNLLQSNDPRYVAFYLYPDQNNMTDNDVIILGDSESLSKSRYNSSNTPLFIIHGFLNNYTTRYSQTVKNEFLKQGFSNIHNILVVDWGRLATPANLTAWLSQLHDPLKDLYYKASVNNVPKVGNVISQFISFLITEQYLHTPANVTLLGFSLGAQISGFAGKYVKQSSNSTIGRITGFDPAGPLYQSASANERLNANDGTFVDVIHSNQGQDGYFGNAGTADFYPNGGGPNQPDCLDIGIDLVPNTISGTCAHNRAWIYYLKALSDNVTGCRCLSQADLICRAFCTNKARFGYFCPTTASGSYYFDIYSKEP